VVGDKRGFWCRLQQDKANEELRQRYSGGVNRSIAGASAAVQPSFSSPF